MHITRLLMATLTGLGLALTAHAQSDAVPDALARGELHCDQGSARALPGEFNFCLAQKYWGQARYDSAAQLLELASSWGNKAA